MFKMSRDACLLVCSGCNKFHRINILLKIIEHVELRSKAKLWVRSKRAFWQTFSAFSIEVQQAGYELIYKATCKLITKRKAVFQPNNEHFKAFASSADLSTSPTELGFLPFASSGVFRTYRSVVISPHANK